jgi:hypothetical protein
MVDFGDGTRGYVLSATPPLLRLHSSVTSSCEHLIAASLCLSFTASSFSASDEPHQFRAAQHICTIVSMTAKLRLHEHGRLYPQACDQGQYNFDCMQTTRSEQYVVDHCCDEHPRYIAKT